MITFYRFCIHNHTTTPFAKIAADSANSKHK